MTAAQTFDAMVREQDQRIADAVQKESGRLRNFIRRRVDDPALAEDILQDAFYELVTAYRLTKQIEHVGAWLMTVVRNRITDRFRTRKQEVSTATPVSTADDGDTRVLEDLLPSPDAGPEAAYARSVLLEELEDALDELPQEQREVFIAQEIEGRTFRELSEETGVSINTLLSRKRYAVQSLRRRLHAIYDEFER